MLDMFISGGASLRSIGTRRRLLGANTYSLWMSVIFFIGMIVYVGFFIYYLCRKKSVSGYSKRVSDLYADTYHKTRGPTFIFFFWFIGMRFLIALNISLYGFLGSIYHVAFFMVLAVVSFLLQTT